MNLAHGGHLTHGHKLNFSGKPYNMCPTACARKTIASITTKGFALSGVFRQRRFGRPLM